MIIYYNKVVMATKKPTPKQMDIVPPRRATKSKANSAKRSAVSTTQISTPTQFTSSNVTDAGSKYDPQEGMPSKLKKRRLSKKTKLIIAAVAFVFIIAAVAIYFWPHRHSPTSRASVATKNIQTTIKPATAPSLLTGVEVSPEAAKQPVVAVVIENFYPDARPQSGLSSAGVVYEALAEGGITRYLAMFQDSLAPDIGPVRSLRTYFIDWGLEYNAPVAHVGGNADALDLIKPLNMKNLDQFYNGSYFRRVTSRYAPHNVYINDVQMKKLLNDRGYAGEPTFTPWPRKDDKKPDSLTASTITVNFSGADYQAKFEFDPGSNCYVRFVRNTPDVDANDKVAVKPKNVIVMYMPTQFGATKIGEATVVMQTVGTGKAIIFMDGVATEATWKKASHEGRTQFYDASGTEIKLNRGQTWVSVVPVGKEVSYK